MSDDPLTWARDHCPILGSLREDHDDALKGYTVARSRPTSRRKVAF